MDGTPSKLDTMTTCMPANIDLHGQFNDGISTTKSYHIHMARLNDNIIGPNSISVISLSPTPITTDSWYDSDSSYNTQSTTSDYDTDDEELRNLDKITKDEMMACNYISTYQYSYTAEQDVCSHSDTLVLNSRE